MTGSYSRCTHCGTYNRVDRDRCSNCRRPLLVVVPSEKVRVDRIVAPYWRALTAEERAAIETSVPDGHYVTVTAHLSHRHDYTARLVRASLSVDQPAILVRAIRGHSLGLTLRTLLEWVPSHV